MTTSAIEQTLFLNAIHASLQHYTEDYTPSTIDEKKLLTLLKVHLEYQNSYHEVIDQANPFLASEALSAGLNRMYELFKSHKDGNQS